MRVNDRFKDGKNVWTILNNQMQLINSNLVLYIAYLLNYW